MNLELLNSLELKQGDIIPQDVLEKIIGFTFEADPYQYNFEVLRVAANIEDTLSQEWGDRSCKVVSKNRGLKLLTEPEIIDYYIAERRRLRKKTMTAKYHLSSRAENELSDHEKEKLQATAGYYNMMVQAHKKAMRKHPMPKPEKETLLPPMKSFKSRRRRFA